MSLSRLAIRAKKSLSGLYPFSNDDEDNSPRSVDNSKPSTARIEMVHPDLGEFGVCGPGSPSFDRDSPSRRRRLLGSLRSMGSLRSLRSNNSKASEEICIPPETPPRSRPSLALNFQLSPPDQPMFGSAGNFRRSARHSNSNHSRPGFQPSSPIAVPMLANPAASSCSTTPPGLTTFHVGALPDSPAPLQQASVQEAILNHSIQAVKPSASDGQDLILDPIPTPMPGTNLTLEDIGTLKMRAPSSPAMPTEQKNDHDYFDLAGVQGDENHERIDSVVGTEYATLEDAELLANTAVTIVEIDDSLQPPIPGILRPVSSSEAPIEELGDDPFTLAGETDASFDDSPDLAFAYLALQRTNSIRLNQFSQCGLERRRSTWSRHTGLYDGTGYGEDTASTSGLSGTPDTTMDGVKLIKETISEEDKKPAKVSHVRNESVWMERKGKVRNTGDDVQGTQDFDDQKATDGGNSVESNETLRSPAEDAAQFDEKATLQEILRAYAAPMFYDEDVGKERVSERGSSFSEQGSEDLYKCDTAEISAISLVAPEW
ncbi:hypothetical protein BDV95DRAFT_612146 [Massariosphaeria phaeospora]|uniref:Uncharacterized protein n=1 Tax=Massariosphaeria phaeospora TaxID=100035 RepID=A0A7C8M7N5_9PLEO|nr:hypothetical protein BDV95DRAFT_612146 [Massariosphaeria phaeospora]